MKMKSPIKTPQGRASAHSAISPSAGLTAIIKRPDGREFFRTEFNPSERRCIEACAKSAGITLADFFLKAVENLVASRNKGGA